MTSLAALPDRAVLEIAGADRVGFLNGLVSNDVAQAAPGRAVWAALLSPQGKWLADFFILADGDRLLLDCEAAQADDIARRLSRYRLRSAVTIATLLWRVHAAWGGAPEGFGAIAAPDPRLPEAGWRLLGPEALPTNATHADWDLHRLRLGLPDGSRDLVADKSLLLEAGFDGLHGVSWTKGCYMGQELTARTRYRGLIKRRLLKVTADGDVPAPGTLLFGGNGMEAGEMRSGRGTIGLATVRLGAIDDTLAGGDIALRVHRPTWEELGEGKPLPPDPQA